MLTIITSILLTACFANKKSVPSQTTPPSETVVTTPPSETVITTPSSETMITSPSVKSTPPSETVVTTPPSETMITSPSVKSTQSSMSNKPLNCQSSLIIRVQTFKWI
ncbi:hypothetical protein BGP_5375 [Beggiatoa sp. PS]|nr:hypothetical protein BGP_5375 [Beggiatoa sp. PS]